MKLTKQQLEQIEYEVLQYGDYVKARYYEMVANGQNPRFALMCAVQQAPGTRLSDRTFNAERHEIMSTMKPKQRAKYLQLAKKAGISTQGKYYVGALGRPTDPMAWVSTVDEAKHVCKVKNLTASGLVENKGTPQEYKKTRMAKDVQERLAQEAVKGDAAKARRYARDPSYRSRIQGEVIDRHSSSGSA